MQSARSARRRELSEAEVAEFHRDGFLVLPEVFSDTEVDDRDAECHRLWTLPGLLDGKNLRTQVVGSPGRQPDRLDPVIDLSPRFRELACDQRLLGPVRQLLGGEGRLFKDKLIFKPPGMKGYRSHQDYAYWQWLPAPPDALLTAMVTVDPTSSLNGALEVFPGLHRELLTPLGEVRDLDERHLAHVRSGTLLETSPRDLVLFHSLTPHRSGTNRSPGMRRQLFFSYGLAALGDLYSQYYHRLHETLRVGLPVESYYR